MTLMVFVLSNVVRTGFALFGLYEAIQRFQRLRRLRRLRASLERLLDSAQPISSSRRLEGHRALP